MNNTNSKDYWNNYVSYWENKVSEANDTEKHGDKTNSDKVMEAFFNKLNVKESDQLLDYGCGSCRLYPIYSKRMDADGYHGIDIARICLEHAAKEYDKLSIGTSLFEFDGVNIPFADEEFDKIMCFGVLDACNQENTLKELIRVLKIGGMCLLTGKNNKYYEDDSEALIAEINARKKGHPNYFSDVDILLSQLEKNGINVIEIYYFAKRGDFPKLNYVKQKPRFFYEWAIIMKKESACNNIEIEKFSSLYSETYVKMDSK